MFNVINGYLGSKEKTNLLNFPSKEGYFSNLDDTVSAVQKQSNRNREWLVMITVTTIMVAFAILTQLNDMNNKLEQLNNAKMDSYICLQEGI